MPDVDEEWDHDIPPGIGPHEGRELELMLAGKKPLAMFTDDLPEGMEPPEVSFDPYVAKGRFLKAEITLPLNKTPKSELRYYLYALPEEDWRIERMIELQRGFHEDRLPTTPELETEIGRLLGYDDADIAVFVDRWFRSKG